MEAMATLTVAGASPNSRMLASTPHDRLASSSVHCLCRRAAALPALRKRISPRHLVFRAHTETAVPEVDKSTCPKVKPEVDVATFQSLDIRVGLVTDAKPVPDKEMSEKRGKPTMSRKLLHLMVDIGCETRSVVSECKYVMDVEDAVGKKVMFVANVPATEVEGIPSHGIVLTGLNYDPTPMPRSFKVTLPGLGRLPPGSQLLGAHIPR